MGYLGSFTYILMDFVLQSLEDCKTIIVLHFTFCPLILVLIEVALLLVGSGNHKHSNFLPHFQFTVGFIVAGRLREAVKSGSNLIAQIISTLVVTRV